MTRTHAHGGAAVATTLALGLAVLAGGASPAAAQQYPPVGGSPSPSASPSATSTASPTSSPTPGATTSPAPSASTPTTTPSAVQSAPSTTSPTPSATVTPSQGTCRGVALSPSEQQIDAGSTADVLLKGAGDSDFEVSAYTRPKTTYMVVRRVSTTSNGQARLEFTPPRNTRIMARQINCQGTAPASNSVVIRVRKTVSVNARRVNGTRPIPASGSRRAQTGEYEISGSTLPRPSSENETVTVYERKGQTFTALGSTTIRPNGTYSLLRRFQRTGPITIVTRSDRNLNNDSGQSADKSFTIRR